MAERWLPIPGYEGLYEASDEGRILSVKQRIILKPQPRKGYLRVNLCRGGERRKFFIHHLVLLTFDKPCPPGQECRHLNNRRDDNRRTNLQWSTRLVNMRDKRQHHDPAAPHPDTHCANGHEWTPANTYEAVRPDGHHERHCRKCRRERYRAKRGKVRWTSRTKYNPTGA